MSPRETRLGKTVRGISVVRREAGEGEWEGCGISATTRGHWDELRKLNQAGYAALRAVIKSYERDEELDRHYKQLKGYGGKYHELRTTSEGCDRHLVALRRRARLSQVEVARRMGTTQSAISALEGGEHDPYLSTLQRYARAVEARVELKVHVPSREPQDQSPPP